MANYKSKPYELTLTALTAAVTCILGPCVFVLPFSPIPVTFGLLGIMLATTLLGSRLGTISCLIYLLLGCVGLPVFSGFTGGLGVFLGPTGGYLLGYLWFPMLSGRFQFMKKAGSVMGMLIGLSLCYLCGTAWLAYCSNIGYKEALFIGVLPYLPFDLFKLFVACFLGNIVRKRLYRAGLSIY